MNLTSKFFPTLYKLTKNGLIQSWSIVVEGNKYFTIEGIVDGKLTTSTPIVCTGKSIWRSNQTTPSEQATREAQSKWQKKLDSGYSEDPEKLEDKFFQVMLAKNYDDYVDKLVYPLWAQPKLDGIRCVAEEEGLWSRNGKPHVAVPHIYEELKVTFSYPFFEHKIIFDGELYADKFKNDFNTISSLVKRPNQHKKTWKCLHE